MWAFLDHINAILVGSVVAVISLSVLIAGQGESVGTTSRAAAVGALATTVEWVERDLTNVGAGVPAGDPVVVDASWSGLTPSVTFVTGADTSVTAAPQTVRYERVSTGGGAFELRRYEVGPAGDRLTARSPPTLRSVEVHVRSHDGSEVADPSEARTVEVRLSMAPPSGARGPVEWARRFVIRTPSE